MTRRMNNTKLKPREHNVKPTETETVRLLNAWEKDSKISTSGVTNLTRVHEVKTSQHAPWSRVCSPERSDEARRHELATLDEAVAHHPQQNSART